jgi:tripartite-type tricarboxylate transporter receptor subunit TctC
VPPIAEAGLPGYEFVAWFALVAPRGTPREIIAALNDHFRKAMNLPDTVQRLEADGIGVVGSTPEELGAMLESELKKLAVVTKERNMRAE